MLKNFLFVALGGALGASLRYGVALLGTYLGSSSQTVTFLINIVGSFLLGFLTAMTPSGSLMMFPLNVVLAEWNCCCLLLPRFKHETQSGRRI